MSSPDDVEALVVGGRKLTPHDLEFRDAMIEAQGRQIAAQLAQVEQLSALIQAQLRLKETAQLLAALPKPKRAKALAAPSNVVPIGSSRKSKK